MDSIASFIEYRGIPDFPGYRFGNDGTVWSCWKRGPVHEQGNVWRQLKTPIRSKGYPLVGLYKNGKRYSKDVHILILISFLGPCPLGLEACHENEIKIDNRL